MAYKREGLANMPEIVFRQPVYQQAHVGRSFLLFYRFYYIFHDSL